MSMSKSSLSNKMKRGSYTAKDLIELAEMTGNRLAIVDENDKVIIELVRKIYRQEYTYKCITFKSGRKWSVFFIFGIFLLKIKNNAIKYDTVAFNNNFRHFVLYVFVFRLHACSLLFFLPYPVNWRIPRILVFLPVPLILFLPLAVFCLLKFIFNTSLVL